MEAMSKEALKLALEALEYDTKPEPKYGISTAINILKEALAKQEQGEPVAWMLEQGPHVEFEYMDYHDGVEWTPLYTTPQQRTWVGLTNEDISICLDAGDGSLSKILSLIEAKLKEKNT